MSAAAETPLGSSACSSARSSSAWSRSARAPPRGLANPPDFFPYLSATLLPEADGS